MPTPVSHADHQKQRAEPNPLNQVISVAGIDSLEFVGHLTNTNPEPSRVPTMFPDKHELGFTGPWRIDYELNDNDDLVVVWSRRIRPHGSLDFGAVAFGCLLGGIPQTVHPYPVREDTDTYELRAKYVATASGIPGVPGTFEPVMAGR